MVNHLVENGTHEHVGWGRCEYKSSATLPVSSIIQPLFMFNAMKNCAISVATRGLRLPIFFKYPYSVKLFLSSGHSPWVTRLIQVQLATVHERCFLGKIKQNLSFSISHRAQNLPSFVLYPQNMTLLTLLT